MNYAIYLKNHSVILVIVVLHTWVMQYSTMVKGCPIAGMVLHADPLMALHTDPLMALHADPFMALHADPLMALHADPLMAFHADPLMALHADPLMALHADPLMALQAELKLVKINYLTKQLHQNSSNTNQQKS